MTPVPMREDCKHYESRTYAGGETVRKCQLDLAPEAPWACPPDCGSYAPRLADVNWAHTGLVAPPLPPEPTELGEDVAALLDEAEDVVNAAGPRIMAELDDDARAAGGRRWWRRRRRH